MRNPHLATDETRKLVRTLSAYGIPLDRICKLIGVSYKTLAKHYREELENAATEANAQVAGALFKQAMAGNVTAQIFWLKTRARWTAPAEGDSTNGPRLGKKQQAQADAKGAATGTDWGNDLTPSVN